MFDSKAEFHFDYLSILAKILLSAFECVNFINAYFHCRKIHIILCLKLNEKFKHKWHLTSTVCTENTLHPLRTAHRCVAQISVCCHVPLLSVRK